MSIVISSKIQHDPQTLLYHFPGIDKVRYTRLSQEYYFWKSVQAAEQAAAIVGCLLVPASCLHWERKLAVREKGMKIGKFSYFILRRDEMTAREKMKYDTEQAKAFGNEEEVLSGNF